ncbi:hypothetical protein YTPLAS73_01660 [Nitrosarchaeum sp.]|nr:hypothetical protein YTPLAS73_01660 [Nitrosarchaeum sp.]
MVKITHNKRFPALRRDFDPWFESSFSPFSTRMFPWFREDPFEEMEERFRGYLGSMERYIPNLEESMQKLTKDIYCDVDDRGDKFVLTADLPGMNKDEIKVNVLDSQIEITAEHKESKEEKKKGSIRSERSHVKYYRTMTFPEEIVGSGVNAKMNNGILTVELPKKTPTKVEEPVAVKVQ